MTILGQTCWTALLYFAYLARLLKPRKFPMRERERERERGRERNKHKKLAINYACTSHVSVLYMHGCISGIKTNLTIQINMFPFLLQIFMEVSWCIGFDLLTLRSKGCGFDSRQCLALLSFSKTISPHCCPPPKRVNVWVPPVGCERYLYARCGMCALP